MEKYAPSHFSNVTVHLPSCFKTVSILYSSSLPRSNNSKLFRGIRFPDPDVTVV